MFQNWLGAFVVKLVVVAGLACPSVAQTLSSIERAERSIADLDRMIDEIESRVSLLSLSVETQSSGSNDTGDTGEGGAQTVTDTGPTLERRRSNPACFAALDQPLETPEELTAYFASVDAAAISAEAYLTAFDALTLVQGDGACLPRMTELTVDAQQALAGISQDRVAALSVYLEDCWPGDDLRDAQGVPVNMDDFYRSARASFRALRDTRTKVFEASKKCK